MTSIGTWRTILLATGVHASVVPFGLSLATVLLWRNGMITAFGPFELATPLPVVLAASALLGVSCGISHIPVRTPVIIKNARTVYARLISHSTLLGGGIAVVSVGALVGPAGSVGPALRNLFVFSSLALAAAALAGPAYSWFPVIVLFGTAILSNTDDSAWSVYGLVMAPQVQLGQFLVIVGVCLWTLMLAAFDPRGTAYLPRKGLRGRE